MRAKGKRWDAARVLGVGCVALVAAHPVCAQQALPPPPPTSGAEIDPTAPLDAMPDLGVEWPEHEEPRFLADGECLGAVGIAGLESP